MTTEEHVELELPQDGQILTAGALLVDESDTIDVPAGPVDLALLSQIEAVVFAAPTAIKPVEVQEILSHFDLSCTVNQIEIGLEALVVQYDDRGGGIRLVSLPGEGFQFQTVKKAGPIMERMFLTRPRPLSRASLETLAIIAYRQPATRAEVEKIRAVDTGSIIKTLLDRGLIRCAGRRDDAGRPMVFETDTEFLRVFGITSLADLPPLSAFQPAPEVMLQAAEHLSGVAAPDASELALPGEVSDRPDVPQLSEDSGTDQAMDLALDHDNSEGAEAEDGDDDTSGEGSK